MRFRIALFTIICSCLTAQTSQAPEVRAFLQWYEGYPGSLFPQDVMKAYMQRMSEEGADATESKRRMDVVQTALRSMPAEFTVVHFNKIYTAKERLFRAEPSAFMVRAIEGRKPGTALDVAMGQGRNAIHLASQGWSVTGYDLSTAGLAEAENIAKQRGLTIRAVRASHDEFDYGKEQWDLIVETYAFTNLNDANYRKRIIDSLKPGGLLVIEGFGGGGPKNVFLEAFRDLRVLAYEDREEIADWSLRKARLTRIAAQKD